MAVCKFHRRYGDGPTRGDGGIEPGAAYLLPITADALSVEPSSARRFCSPGPSKPGIFAEKKDAGRNAFGWQVDQQMQGGRIGRNLVTGLLQLTVYRSAKERIIVSNNIERTPAIP